MADPGSGFPTNAQLLNDVGDALLNLAIWFVTPVVILLFLLKPLLWLRYLILRIPAYFIAWWYGRRMGASARCLVVAMPLYLTTVRQRRLWGEVDGFATFLDGRCLGGWFLVMERLHPEEKTRAVERLIKEFCNHLGTYYRGWYEVVFDWIGFTGAMHASVLQVHGYVTHRANGRLVLTPVFGRSRRLWGHGMRERSPSSVRKAGMGYLAKRDEAERQLREATAKIDEDKTMSSRARRHAVRVEEARIAANLAEHAGQAVRLLRDISLEDKSPETILEQLPLLLSRVYSSDELGLSRPSPTQGSTG